MWCVSLAHKLTTTNWHVIYDIAKDVSTAPTIICLVDFDGCIDLTHEPQAREESDGPR